MTLRTSSCLGALLCAAASPVLAVDAQLDPLVVTGSRVEHSSFDLPAAIDSIGPERIDTGGPRVNASEALAGVPGLVVQNRQNYAQDLQISSRGFGARTAFGVRGIRLVADGIPVSMPDGQGQVASFNLDRAERLEVMRGPLSAIYGNAAGGVIQLFTADGQGEPTVDGRFSAGSYGTWKADLGMQGEQNGIGYVLDTSRFATDGYRDHSAAERDQSMAKLTWRPSTDGKLSLIASHFRQMAQDPQGLQWDEYRNNPRGLAYDSTRGNTPALAYDTRKAIEHMQGGLSYEHRFGDSTLFLAAYTGQRSTLQYQSIPRDTQLITGATAANAAVRKQAGGIIDFDRSFSGLSGRWTRRDDVAGGRLTTTAGFDYEQSEDNRQGYENYIGTTLGVMGEIRRNELDRVSSFDQYLQAEWQGERWGFNGGLRHSRVAFRVEDRYIATGNGDDSGRVTYARTTPTAGVLYRLSETANWYASAARGFETPTFNEMFYSSGGGSFNFNLKPSTSRHLETGLKTYLGGGTRLDVALFHVATQDELVVLSSSGGRTAYQNAGATRRQGLEMALDSRWSSRVTSRLAYTWLDARYDETFTFTTAPPSPVTKTVLAGNRIPGIAAQTLYGEVAWRHPAGYLAAVEGVARSNVQVEDTNTARAAPGYAVLNLRAGYDTTLGAAKLGVFLRVDNVFDRQYVGSVIVGDSNGRYYESAPGRSLLLGMSLRYAL